MNIKDIYIYRDANCQGDWLQFNEACPNLKDYKYGSVKANDRTSSCDIQDANGWLFYQDSNFNGDCAFRKGPKQYNHGDEMGIPNDSLSSLQPVPIAATKPTIAFFPKEGYRGQETILEGPEIDLTNLGVSNVESIVVCNGVWYVYPEINYGGTGRKVDAADSPNGDGWYAEWKLCSIKSAKPA